MSSRKDTPVSNPSPGVSFALPDLPLTPSSCLSNGNNGSSGGRQRSTILNSKRNSNIRSNRSAFYTPKTLDNADIDIDADADVDADNNAVGVHADVDTPVDNSLMILPPSQTILESLTAISQSTSSQLVEIWDEIGLNPEDRGDQLKDLLYTFREVCENKVASEREVADNYKQMIVDYKQEIRATSNALKLPLNESLLKEETSQTLQDEVYTLELALEDLRNEADVARQDLIKCRDQLIDDHEALGTPIDEEWTDVVSDLTRPRVRAFQEKAKQMEAIVATRTSAVIQHIRDSQELINVLRIKPDDNLLDRKIMNSLIKDDDGNINIASKLETDDCTGISAKTLQALIDRVRQLHSEKRRRKAKLAEMGETIGGLWEKLHVAKEEQNAFAKSIDGLGLDTLEKGEQEIIRLHSLKEAMMGGLIAEARARIESLWDETNTSDEQRALFKGMQVEDEACLNDALLTEHEDYIQDLEARLEQMRPILEVVEKREAIIKERMQYEEFLKDPSRLNQRGAALTRQLMKEEKMSRRIKKDLPKYTNHLTKKLNEWTETHNEAFLYKGEDYLTMMQDQEDQWQEYKENQAQLKRQKKQQERSTYASKSTGSYPGRKVGSSASTASAPAGPLEDRTNKKEKTKARPLSRFRALSRGRERGEKNEKRAMSRTRGLSRTRDKSKEARSRGNASRGRGILSRGRAKPVQRS